MSIPSVRLRRGGVWIFDHDHEPQRSLVKSSILIWNCWRFLVFACDAFEAMVFLGPAYVPTTEISYEITAVSLDWNGEFDDDCTVY